MIKDEHTGFFDFHRRQNFCVEQAGALKCGLLPVVKHLVILANIHPFNWYSVPSQGLDIRDLSAYIHINVPYILQSSFEPLTGKCEGTMDR
jgi:hypothetical protein